MSPRIHNDKFYTLYRFYCCYLFFCIIFICICIILPIHTFISDFCSQCSKVVSYSYLGYIFHGCARTNICTYPCDMWMNTCCISYSNFFQINNPSFFFYSFFTIFINCCIGSFFKLILCKKDIHIFICTITYYFYSLVVSFFSLPWYEFKFTIFIRDSKV